MAITQEIPPEGCIKYEKLEDVPRDTRKYWLQRHNLFSRFDEGIWMNETGWYSVTPEPIAEAIATHVAEGAPPERTIMIDAFAGLGGNAIAFAKSGRWEQVFAVEKDAATLECAKHNAAIYGVKNKIVWIRGDVFAVIKTRLKSIGKKAVIFASPPWGGPSYNEDEVYDLSKMKPYNLDFLYQTFTKMSPELVLYLPRNSDLQQIADLANDEQLLEVTHYCIKRASKALCVYFGEWSFT